jgi:hypothetical protein
MITNCYSTSGKYYKYYGARGILVCDSWLNSFEEFKADIGPRPSMKHMLCRRDVRSHYTPNNCFWGTIANKGRGGGAPRKLTEAMAVEIYSLHKQGRTWVSLAEQFGLSRETIRLARRAALSL